MKPVAVLLSVLAIAGTARAAEPNLYQDLVSREPHVAPADQRIFYGAHLVQFGDLRLPRGKGPFPVAVVIHGGAWRSHVALHYTAPLAAAMTCAGVATWNIEYRRLGGDGEWPAMFKDVAAATDYVRELARKYPLDAGKVITIGHSAGGHFATWAAARPRLPKGSDLASDNPLPVTGVINLSGPGDLETFMAASPYFAPILREAVGGGTEAQVSERMKLASPAHLLPLGVPQVQIGGEKDPAVPAAAMTGYMDKARKSGDRVTTTMILGAGHFESVDPRNPAAGRAILDALHDMAGIPVTAQTKACFGIGD